MDASGHLPSFPLSKDNKGYSFEEDGLRIGLSNLDKVFWPGRDLRKAHLLAYVHAIAPLQLGYLRDRPLVLTRYPDGIDGPSFYEKRIAPHAPDFLRSEPLPSGEGTIAYIVASRRIDLLWLANMAAFEFHVFTAVLPAHDLPDVLLIDLDPALGTGFEEARLLGLLVRALFAAMGIDARVKTTGGDGLHIIVPIKQDQSYAAVRAVARKVGDLLRQTVPDKVTLEPKIADRTGRVYVDWLQNGEGKTIAAPYAIRPRPMAPASCPITWDELESGITPEDLTLTDIPKRIVSGTDVWGGSWGDPIDLRTIQEALGLEQESA